jgi:hypothetical protein
LNAVSYQNVIHLVALLSLRGSPGVFMNVAVGEHCTSDYQVFGQNNIIVALNESHKYLRTPPVRVVSPYYPVAGYTRIKVMRTSEVDTTLAVFEVWP